MINTNDILKNTLYNLFKDKNIKYLSWINEEVKNNSHLFTHYIYETKKVKSIIVEEGTYFVTLILDDENNTELELSTDLLTIENDTFFEEIDSNTYLIYTHQLLKFLY